jgi:hypothetical protein
MEEEKWRHRELVGWSLLDVPACPFDTAVGALARTMPGPAITKYSTGQVNEQLLLGAAQTVSGECLDPRRSRLREGAMKGAQHRENVHSERVLYFVYGCKVITSHAWP